jgi:hypothetical protein
MIETGANPALIYVFDKTGFLPSTENRGRFSPEEILEIDSAFDEFNEEDHEYALDDYLDDNFENHLDLTIALYVFGNFIERNFVNDRMITGYSRFVSYYLIFRSYRLLRSIWKLSSTNSSEEHYILVRSLFEIYCKLCFVRNSEKRAKKLFDIDYGMAMGDFKYEMKGDKVIRSRIRRISNGEIIDKNISFFTMISHSRIREDLDLFESVYEYLSSFAHSGIRHIFKEFDRSSFLFSVNGGWEDNFGQVAVKFMTGMITAMIMQHMHGLKGVSAFSKRDIEYYCRVAKTMASRSEIEFGSTENELQAFRLLFKRMKRLPSRRSSAWHSSTRS